MSAKPDQNRWSTKLTCMAAALPIDDASMLLALGETLPLES